MQPVPSPPTSGGKQTTLSTKDSTDESHRKRQKTNPLNTQRPTKPFHYACVRQDSGFRNLIKQCKTEPIVNFECAYAFCLDAQLVAALYSLLEDKNFAIQSKAETELSKPVYQQEKFQPFLLWLTHAFDPRTQVLAVVPCTELEAKHIGIPVSFLDHFYRLKPCECYYTEYRKHIDTLKQLPKYKVGGRGLIDEEMEWNYVFSCAAATMTLLWEDISVFALCETSDTIHRKFGHVQGVVFNEGGGVAHLLTGMDILLMSCGTEKSRDIWEAIGRHHRCGTIHNPGDCPLPKSLAVWKAGYEKVVAFLQATDETRQKKLLELTTNVITPQTLM